MKRYYAGMESYDKDDKILHIIPEEITQTSSSQVISGLGTGNSLLLRNIMSPYDSEQLFQQLIEEVQFQEMSQAGGVVPRLVAIQGVVIPVSNSIDKQSHIDYQSMLYPLYRHPIDSELPLVPMTPTVLQIKDKIEQSLLDGQIFNHVLIQLYRYGKDHINEHSDKTLDILRGTNIINFSVGSSRTFVLRMKKDSPYASSEVKQVQKIVLPHNSAFVCSWDTNAHFLHGIRPDKREDKFKHENELSFSGMRISLTFRSIATYTLVQRDLGAKYSKIDSVADSEDDAKVELFGQGAKIKEIPTSYPIPTYLEQVDVEKSTEESLRLLSAFSKENRQSNFDWDLHYGRGFNIIKIETIEDLSSSDVDSTPK